MNIVLPMGGLGTRFARDGYRLPKPLVKIMGRPMVFWLLDRLAVQAEDTVFVAVMEDVEAHFAVAATIQQEFHKRMRVKPVYLKFDTGGAAETLFVVLQTMTPAERARRTISLDCDTFYFEDILGSFRALPPGESATYYFVDDGDEPVYSYVTLGDDGRVTGIREKVAISRHANTGAYAFASAELLHRYCTAVLDSAVGAAGEYYTSSVLLRMVQAGEVVRGVLVRDFACVGTPRQLREFMQRLRHDPKLFRKQRFCFDLDNTLVTYPSVPGDYSTVEPIARNIHLVRELKALGHTIIIYTARRMKTHGGNMGALIKDVALVTLAKLQEFDVPYDEIYFGKPYADVYVDDLAVNALVDTNKELGWLEVDAVADTADAANGGSGSKRGMIAPRAFNSVQVFEDLVIKTIDDPACAAGERYFYEHVPPALAHLFPAVRGAIETAPATNGCVLRLERIRAPTCSHLLVSRCLTPARLEAVLRGLHDIHTAAAAPAAIGAPAATPPPGNIYCNYASKVRARLAQHAGLYQAVDPGAQELGAAILAALDAYEADGRGVRANVIHGDPVLSNVLLSRDARVRFIDMRGALGPTLTLEGDVAYDYAKVLQSLCGYDFIIHDTPMADADRALLSDLRATLFARVRAWHGAPGTFTSADLLMLTASHFFSLIPLHVNGHHQRQCYAVCQQLVAWAHAAAGRSEVEPPPAITGVGGFPRV